MSKQQNAIKIRQAYMILKDSERMKTSIKLAANDAEVTILKDLSQAAAIL